MVIKTLRCKQSNQFGRLVKYVLSEKSRKYPEMGEPFMVVNHIRSLEDEGITNAFSANDDFRKKRKNGVAMYHEILSWHEDDTANLTMESLEDMAREYVRIRGENALCVAAPHFDRSHWHIHFLFSGTEYKSDKTLRMDNKRFEDIRRGIEEYQLEKYPELTHSIVHTNKPKRERKNSIVSDKNTRKENEYQAKRRSKKQLDKEHISKVVAQNLERSKKEKQFFAQLEKEENLRLYTYRGKITGIIFNKRKYRFSTLGIDKVKLEKLRSVETEVELRLAELEKLRSAKSLKRGKGRSVGRDGLPF